MVLNGFLFQLFSLLIIHQLFRNTSISFLHSSFPRKHQPEIQSFVFSTEGMLV